MIIIIIIIIIIINTLCRYHFEHYREAKESGIMLE